MRVWWWLPVLFLSEAAHAEAPATLRFFNRDVVTLRSSYLDVAPPARVRAAERRLHEALLVAEVPVVTARAEAIGITVALNDRPIFSLQPGDLDPEAGLSLEVVAERARADLAAALQASRAQTELASVTRGAIAFGVATIVGLLLLGLVLWGRRWLLGLIVRRLGARTGSFRVGPLSVVQWPTVAMVAAGLVRLAATLAGLVLVVEWVAFGLSQFGYTQPWGERLQDVLLSLVGQMALTIASAVPDLLVVALIIWLTWSGTRVLAVFFRQVELGRWTTSWLTPETASITRKMSTLVLVLFALAMAYPYLPGSQTEAFKGLSVLIGLMVSLGGSSTIGQAASGLILIYTHAMSVGDQVRIGEVAGRVTGVGMFTTRLLTAMGEEIVLPNTAVLSTSITNFTRETRDVMVQVQVSIGYDTSWQQIEALLLEGARRTPTVAPTPAPRVLTSSLEDFYVVYRLVVAMRGSGLREELAAELQQHVLDAFNEANVQIMSPHYMMDPSAPKIAVPTPAASPT
ncbi:MAG: mechanosensitive ion channel [Archangium sp.]|nr:mechanosensitive ion channel [Archangium sp.]